MSPDSLNTLIEDKWEKQCYNGTCCLPIQVNEASPAYGLASSATGSSHGHFCSASRHTDRQAFTL